MVYLDLDSLFEASGSASRGDLRALEQALDRSALGRRGSRSDATTGEPVAEGGPARRGRRPSVAKAFLRLEPSLVGDDLLVAVLLAGSTRRSPREVAGELLAEAGGNLARLEDRAVFRYVSGVGEAGRARLVAASELYRRATYRANAEVERITGPAAAVRLLRSMATGPYEKLVAVYLDNRGRVLATRVLTRGSAVLTIVDPRMVFRPAVELGAASVIMAHQHPSGDASPSHQDRAVTGRVAAAGKALGIPLQDHLVVTGHAYTSLAEEGMITR